MASSLKSAGSGASQSTYWENPSRITASDSSYATQTVPGGEVGGSIYAYNFGFSIPSGSTIEGIIVSIRRKAKNTNSITGIGYLGTLVTTTWTNKSQYKQDGSYWGTSGAVVAWGTSTDNWSLSLSADEINSSTFGFRMYPNNDNENAIIASVDYIEMEIFYTAPSSAIKSVNGLAVASVKTLRSGVLIASGKTWNGLA